MQAPNAQLIFLKKPSEHFFCGVCSDLFLDPVTMKHCGHHFCRSCALKSLECSKSCPLCRSQHTSKDLVAAHFIRTSIEDLRVMCPNSVRLGKGANARCLVLGEDAHQADGANTCRSQVCVRDLEAHLRRCGKSSGNEEESLKKQLKAKTDEVEKLKDLLSDSKDSLSFLRREVSQLEEAVEDAERKRNKAIIALNKCQPPSYHKCDEEEAALFSRMVFPLVDEGVSLGLRNAIYDNVVALDKSWRDIGANELLRAAAIAASLPSMTPNQRHRLCMIIRNACDDLVSGGNRADTYTG